MTSADRRDPVDSGRIDAVSSEPSNPPVSDAADRSEAAEVVRSAGAAGVAAGGDAAAGVDAAARGDAAAGGDAAGVDAAAGGDPAAGAPARMTTAEYNEATQPRAELARARGLAAPYIPGGRDPDAAATARAERPYILLLILMVAVIVGGGILITIAGLIVTGGR